jgi:general stress protein 26
MNQEQQYSNFHHWEKIESFIRTIRICMLMNERNDTRVIQNHRFLHARPMTTLDIINNELYFFVGKDSNKCYQLTTQDNRVNCSYQDLKNQIYVSVSGHARIVNSEHKDLIKKLWNPYCKIFFPLGEDDPDIAVLIVTVDFCEYWDPKSTDTKSGTMTPTIDTTHTVYNSITKRTEVSPTEMEHTELAVHGNTIEVIGYKHTNERTVV